MNRTTLIRRLGEVMGSSTEVTLTLRPVTGKRGDSVLTGRILFVAEQHTSRGTLAAVLDRGPVELPLAIGLTMIKDLRVAEPLDGAA